MKGNSNERSIRMAFVVDQDTCIGCGLCTQLASETFEMNDDGKAEAVHQPESDEVDDAITAMDSCPVDAISDDE